MRGWAGVATVGGIVEGSVVKTCCEEGEVKGMIGGSEQERVEVQFR